MEEGDGKVEDVGGVECGAGGDAGAAEEGEAAGAVAAGAEIGDGTNAADLWAFDDVEGDAVVPLHNEVRGRQAGTVVVGAGARAEDLADDGLTGSGIADAEE